MPAATPSRKTGASLSPSFARGCMHLIPENEGAFGTGCHDIRRSVVIAVRHADLRAAGRAVVDQFRYEFRAAFRLRIANRPIPVENGRTVRIRIEVTLQVREKTFTGDQIGDSVAVYVSERDAVRLGESHAAGV